MALSPSPSIPTPGISSVVVSSPLSRGRVRKPHKPNITTSGTGSKELRALRNRESARRSRLKSKLHVQTMEATYLQMSHENMALRQLIEQLVPRCLQAQSPQLAALLQAFCQRGSTAARGGGVV